MRWGVEGAGEVEGAEARESHVEGARVVPGMSQRETSRQRKHFPSLRTLHHLCRVLREVRRVPGLWKRYHGHRPHLPLITLGRLFSKTVSSL